MPLRTIFKAIVYRKKSFPSKESDTTILQTIYFTYWVSIISSYSNITNIKTVGKIFKLIIRVHDTLLFKLQRATFQTNSLFIRSTRSN